MLDDILAHRPGAKPRAPDLQEAMDWLKNVFPELDDYIIVDTPLPGDSFGNSMVPFLILIDSPAHDDAGHMVETLMHELMHKTDQGLLEAMFDHYLMEGVYHEEIRRRSLEMYDRFMKEEKQKNRGAGCR